MAEIVSLADAVARAVHDGDSVAMEGFTHLIPFAAGREIIRQRRRDLTLIRMTPDVLYDQLIGAGCASRLIFSWGGNPGVGSLHRFRDAVENAWPGPLQLEEHSHAGMANRYVAGASGVPFAILRGYSGTGLEGLPGLDGQPAIRSVTCPFTGERLTAVAALNPDVAVIHAQRADRAGNVQLWGITGVQKEAVLSARRSIVTVEEIVDELAPEPGAIVLPAWVVSYVAAAPGGSHPSYALGYSARDNDFYQAWDVISRDRDRFSRWLAEEVHGEAGSLAAPGRRGRMWVMNATGAASPVTADPAAFTADEMMTACAARALHDGMTCFVGIGLPSAAANLARATHAPNLVLIYESGTIGAKPDRLPLSIGDGILAETADAVVSVPEIFNYWLQPGRIAVGFLGAAQIDKFGNINTTVIGADYAQPSVRLPGAGGAPEIAASCREVIVVVRQSRRSFVDRVDFVTSVGFGDGAGSRERLGLRGAGPRKVITDLGILEPDPATCELTLTGLYPGVTVDDVRAKTGWELAVSDSLTVLEPPTAAELTALRQLHDAAS